MTDRELMQDALDALESSRVFVTSREKIKHPEGTEWYDERIEALRDRLAQPERAECDGGQCGIGGYCKECPKTRPEREWVGLTREELAEIAEFHFHGALSAREFYDDIEAKLKEKNT